MRVLRTVTAKVADLKANLFVRKELDVDHVLYLGTLIEAGVEMKDRITVTEDMRIVNGRHRHGGYELAGIKEIKVDIVKIDDETEFIAEAYKANTGGSKPPTIADTEHTIALLLERNVSMKGIAELLNLPGSVARKYATDVKSRMNRAKLQRAADAVTDKELNIPQAAEQFGVDQDKLKEILSGHKRRSKLTGIGEIQRNLTTIYKGLSQRNASALRKAIQKYEDGDVTKKHVDEVFEHIDSLMKRSMKAVADWKTRFIATNKDSKSNAA